MLCAADVTLVSLHSLECQLSFDTLDNMFTAYDTNSGNVKAYVRKYDSSESVIFDKAVHNGNTGYAREMYYGFSAGLYLTITNALGVTWSFQIIVLSLKALEQLFFKKINRDRMDTYSAIILIRNIC